MEEAAKHLELSGGGVTWKQKPALGITRCVLEVHSPGGSGGCSRLESEHLVPVTGDRAHCHWLAFSAA